MEPPTDSRALSLYDRFPIGNKWRTPDGTIYRIVAWGDGKILAEQPGERRWINADTANTWTRINKAEL